jgi:hypothetical protein
MKIILKWMLMNQVCVYEMNWSVSGPCRVAMTLVMYTVSAEGATRAESHIAIQEIPNLMKVHYRVHKSASFVSSPCVPCAHHVITTLPFV